MINLLSVHADSGADLQEASAELLELLRDLMVIKVHPEPKRVLIPPSELEAMMVAAQDMMVGAIHQVFQTLIKRADEIQRSAHPKLILEMVLLQMCHPVDTATVSEVMSGLLAFEQHLNDVGLGSGLPPLSPPPTFRPIPHLTAPLPKEAIVEEGLRVLMRRSLPRPRLRLKERSRLLLKVASMMEL